MTSLFELMNKELSVIIHDSKYANLENFINSDKESLRFINSLSDVGVYNRDKDITIYSVSETRARHSVITFLMGLVFWRFAEIGSKICKMDVPYSNYDGYRLWLLTSLNHDIAYYSKYLSNPEVIYRNITRHYLFDERSLDFKTYPLSRDILKYSFDEILQYDLWARYFHEKINDNEERVDHGILGGVLAFDRLMKRELKVNLKHGGIVKSACLTIAQHNLFKSNKPEDDHVGEVYKPAILCHDSDSIIGFENPLLLLLSIVDTIECVKRFSRSNNKTRNYVQTLTLLKNIYFEVDKSNIIIDYSKCYGYLERANYLYESFVDYAGSVYNLKKWTCLKTKKRINLYYITY